MKLTFTNERILAVMAHPDDAELLCAGTLARAAADGAVVSICVMCNGNKGVAAAPTDSTQSLADTRRTEAQCAADLLGATLFWFDCPDGELFDGIDQHRQLIEIYRQFRPTLVITHGEQDYHPDHRAVGTIAEAASWFCVSRGHKTNSEPMDSPPALWIADTINMERFEPEYYIDVAPFMSLKQKMLHCHKSQLVRGKDGDFASLEELMVRQAAARGHESSTTAAEAFRQHGAFKRTRSW